MINLDDQRQAAIRRLNAKREFRVHLGVFLLVNTMLIVIWAVTGAGYFWPIWPIGGWGIALVLHAFTVYSQKPVTEEDIRAEIRREAPHDTLEH